MNSIIIHGRLVKDPELKNYTNKKGEPSIFCRFTVAVNRSFGEEADFFNCTIFGKRAEVINKYFQKGSEIALHGEMQCTVKGEGKEREYYWGINVSDFDFCGKKDDASSGSVPAEAPQDSFEEIDVDVPF